MGEPPLRLSNLIPLISLSVQLETEPQLESLTFILSDFCINELRIWIIQYLFFGLEKARYLFVRDVIFIKLKYFYTSFIIVPKGGFK